MSVTKELCGALPDGSQVHQFTLRNSNGMELKVLEYGGIVTRLTARDKSGQYRDVCLGYGNLPEFVLSKNPPYFGAIVGRYCNRIENGTISLDGQTVQLSRNERDGLQILHGGFEGFDKKLWQGDMSEDADSVCVKLSYMSLDGEEGFPGNCSVCVTYKLLKKEDTLSILFRATTDKTTICNLTSHTYINLGGHDSGTILDHEVEINGAKYCPIKECMCPTGEMRNVHGTPFDFQTSHLVGERIEADTDPDIKLAAGYDHSWIINRPADKPVGSLVRAAQIRHPPSGCSLEIDTTLPAVHLYAGNFLPSASAESIPFKDNAQYGKRSGMAFETQFLPDAPNKAEFGFDVPILRPGSVFSHETVFRFSVVP